jgi:hypothetical protein
MSKVEQELEDSKTIFSINKTKNTNASLKNNDIEINKTTFSYIFKESLQGICSNSTSHGIPNIIRANNFATRLFWLILVVGAILDAFIVFFFHLICCIKNLELIKSNYFRYLFISYIIFCLRS